MTKAGAKFNEQERQSAKEILAGMGQHFKGKCKAAARRLERRFSYADLIGTGEEDDVVTFRNVVAQRQLGVRARARLIRRGWNYHRTFDVPLRESMHDVFAEAHGLVGALEDARATTPWIVEAQEGFFEPTQSFRSMETARWHNEPDNRIYSHDLPPYKEQAHCTRGG